MLKKLKTLLFLIIVFILSFGINCVKFPEDVEFNNPVDPEAPNYVGIPSVDLDGDGISSYYDVDDITILSPADGTVTSDGTPTLVVYKFNPSLVKRYHIRISTSESDFENNIVHENDNIPTYFYAIPPGVLENNTTYYWCAKAYDGNKWSDNWSDAFSFTLDITIQVPTIPYLINNSTISDTTPVLDWEDVYDATGYHIQVNTESDFSGTMVIDNDNVLQSKYGITTNLDNVATYYWRVKIKNADGIWGDWSQVWNFNIQIEKPLIPSPSHGSFVADATPLLNWENINVASGYEIEVNESYDFSGAIIASDNTLTISEYQITTALENYRIYYWRVRIKNDDGVWGGWGNTWSFTVDISIGIPINLSPVNGDTINDATPVPDWEDVINAYGYEIQINDTNDFNDFVLINNDSLLESEYQIATPLESNKTYFWRIRVRNEDGVWGDWSDTWSFYVIAASLINATEPNPNIFDSGKPDILMNIVLDFASNIYLIGTWNRDDDQMSAKGKIKKFDSIGNEILFGWDKLFPEESAHITAIMANIYPNDDLIVAYDNSNVSQIVFEKYQNNGDIIPDWKVSIPASNSFPAIRGTILDSSNNLYALVYSQYDHFTVVKIPSNGGSYDVFYQTPANVGSYTKMCKDSSENIVIAYYHRPLTNWIYTIEKLNLSGDVIWSLELPGEQYVLKNIITDDNDDIYLAFSYYTGIGSDWHIKKISATGNEILGKWPIIVDLLDFDRIGAITYSNDGYIYAAGYSDNYPTTIFQVRKFQIDGTEITTGWPIQGDENFPGIITTLLTDNFGNVVVGGYLFSETYDGDWFVHVYDNLGNR